MADLFFVFQGDRVLVDARTGELAQNDAVVGKLESALVAQGEVPMSSGQTARWYEVSASARPLSGCLFEERRVLFRTLAMSRFKEMGRSFQLMDWTRKNRYCGKCQSPMESSSKELSRICPRCKNTVYPRISPAVIVAIERDGQLLLARNARYPEGRYSVLAGFVEPGETLEEAVEREVLEEVGIAIKEITYFGSQPWPFPDSLMVGFSAKWASGELEPDGDEIVSAAWFSPEDLPEHPGPNSISGRLIQSFLSRNMKPK